MSRYVSDLSKDFIINGGDRPDGMRSPGPALLWDFSEPPTENGFGRGYEERDLEKDPVGSLEGSLTPPDFSKEIPLIPREYWADLIEEQESKKTRLSDFRRIGNDGQAIASYDQNGQGYCWAYSTMAAITLQRAKMGLPHVRLSGHSLAAKIKAFRDQGGWCGLSATHAVQMGYVPASMWPEKSMRREHDTAAAWEEAKNYRITEGFLDLQQKAWDMDLTFDQIATCLLSGIACAVDFDWWAHSVCGMDLVSVSDRYPITDARAWGIRIWNSWTDRWGVQGTGVIVGRKAIAMGAVAVRNVFAKG